MMLLHFLEIIPFRIFCILFANSKAISLRKSDLFEVTQFSTQ